MATVRVNQIETLWMTILKLEKKIAKYIGIHMLKFRVTSLEQLSLAEFSG